MSDLQNILTYLTLISVPVGVLYHIMTLNNTRKNQQMTLETRQAQMFLGMINRWRDETKGLNVWEIIGTKLENGEDYLRRHNTDADFAQVMDSMFSFYETLGVFVKQDYVSIHLVALMWAGMTRTFYENVVSQILEDLKIHFGLPRLWSETDYVCKELIKYIDEHPELAT